MSATGIYFETESEVELGPLSFSIALDTAWEDMDLMQCEGHVVRIDEKRPRRGVAARIDHMEF